MKAINTLKNLPTDKKQRISLALSMSVNLLTLAGKIVLAIIVSSGFLAVSAMVTFLSLMTKLTAYLRLAQRSPLSEEKTFGLMSLTITAGAIAYLSYMARLFFFPVIDHYDIYQGLLIAALAFTDLTWAIISLLKQRKSRDIVLIGLKCGSLSNGFSAIVLAQIAILSFTNPGVDFSFDNALGGMVFGCVDLLIGLSMIVYDFKTRKTVA